MHKLNSSSFSQMYKLNSLSESLSFCDTRMNDMTLVSCKPNTHQSSTTKNKRKRKTRMHNVNLFLRKIYKRRRRLTAPNGAEITWQNRLTNTTTESETSSWDCILSHVRFLYVLKVTLELQSDLLIWQENESTRQLKSLKAWTPCDRNPHFEKTGLKDKPFLITMHIVFVKWTIDWKSRIDWSSKESNSTLWFVVLWFLTSVDLKFNFMSRRRAKRPPKKNKKCKSHADAHTLLFCEERRKV